MERYEHPSFRTWVVKGGKACAHIKRKPATISQKCEPVTPVPGQCYPHYFSVKRFAQIVLRALSIGFYNTQHAKSTVSDSVNPSMETHEGNDCWPENVVRMDGEKNYRRIQSRCRLMPWTFILMHHQTLLVNLCVCKIVVNVLSVTELRLGNENIYFDFRYPKKNVCPQRGTDLIAEVFIIVQFQDRRLEIYIEKYSGCVEIFSVSKYNGFESIFNDGTQTYLNYNNQIYFTDVLKFFIKAS